MANLRPEGIENIADILLYASEFQVHLILHKYFRFQCNAALAVEVELESKLNN